MSPPARAGDCGNGVSSTRSAPRRLNRTQRPQARASGVLFIAAKTTGLSRQGGRRPSTLRQAARHNLREIQAELGAGVPIRLRQRQRPAMGQTADAGVDAARCRKVTSSRSTGTTRRRGRRGRAGARVRNAYTVVAYAGMLHGTKRRLPSLSSRSTATWWPYSPPIASTRANRQPNECPKGIRRQVLGW